MANLLQTDFVFNEKDGFAKLDNLDRRLTDIDNKWKSLGGSTNFGGRVRTTTTDVDKLTVSVDRLNAQNLTSQKSALSLAAAFDKLSKVDRGNRFDIYTKSAKDFRTQSQQVLQDLQGVERELAKKPSGEWLKTLEKEAKNLRAELDGLQRQAINLRSKDISNGRLYPTGTPGIGAGGAGGGSFGDSFVNSTFGANFGSAAFLGGLAGGAVIAGLSEVKSLVSSITSEVKDLTVEAVHLAANFEETENSLAIFAGGAFNARRELELMDKAALNTPGLKLEAAEAGYQRLRALNFEAKLSRDLVKGLGTQRVLSGADAASVDRVVTNLIQLSSGAGTAADVRQTIQALPSLIPVFQKAFGTSDFGKINDFAKENPDQFLKRFAAELANAKTAQAGLNVTIEKGTDTLIQAGREFGRPLLSPLTKDVQDLTRLLNENSDTARSWGQSLADAVQGASDAVRGAKAADDNSGGLLSSILLGGGRALLGAGTFGISEGIIGTYRGFENTGRQTREAEEQKKALDALNSGKINLNDLVSLNLPALTNAVKEVPALDEQLKSRKAAEEIEKMTQTLSELSYKTAGDSISQNAEIQKAQIVRDAKGNGLQIARQTAAVEINSLREQIALANDATKARLRVLKPADFTAGKDVLINAENAANIQKLNNQILQTQINLQKSEAEETEKVKNKVKELNKAYIETFDSLARKTGQNNPILQVILEADSAMKNLKESIRGLSPELQAQAIKMQQTINSNSLFSARLDNNLSVFDLQERARELRNYRSPGITDPAKFFSDYLEAGLKKLAANNNGGLPQINASFSADGKSLLGFSQSQNSPYTRFDANIYRDKDGRLVTNGFSQSDARNDIFNTYERESRFGGFVSRRKTFADLTEREKNDFFNKVDPADVSLQQRLQKQLGIINSGVFTEEQRAIADRKALSISSGINPGQLTDSLRNQLAEITERQVQRQIDSEKATAKVMTDLLQVNERIAVSNEALVAIGKKGGVEAILRIINEAGKNVGVGTVPEPNPKDARDAMKR